MFGEGGGMIWLARYLFLIKVHPHACVKNVTTTTLEDPRTRGPLFAMPAEPRPGCTSTTYRSSRGGTG